MGKSPTLAPMMRATSTQPVASPRLQKIIYALQLLSVLAKSNATLEAICGGLPDLKDFEVRQIPAEGMARLHVMTSEPAQRMKASM